MHLKCKHQLHKNTCQATKKLISLNLIMALGQDQTYKTNAKARTFSNQSQGQKVGSCV